MEVLSRPLPGWLSTPLLSPPCFRLRPCYHPHPHIGRSTQGGNMMEASQAVRPHHQARTLSTPLPAMAAARRVAISLRSLDI